MWAVGANILINNLEENGKIPDAEQPAVNEEEVMDVATKEVDEPDEMARKAEEFDDAKELGNVAQRHEGKRESINSCFCTIPSSL